jgi:hypothetical protein
LDDIHVSGFTVSENGVSSVILLASGCEPEVNHCHGGTFGPDVTERDRLLTKIQQRQVKLHAASRITTMTALQSFAPEICSLICQDPFLERLDLKSISFISHAFRAQRELSHGFPCLRGASRARAWCLSLECSPHFATNIRGVILLLPSPWIFLEEDVTCVTQTLYLQVCQLERIGGSL